MPPVRIPLTNLTDGVSTQPMPQRSAGSLTLANNAMMRRIRGFEKRPGTTLVGSDQADLSLDVTTPSNPKFFHWINRDEDERFVVVLDPFNTGTDRVEVFTLVTRGTGDGTPTNEVAGQKMTVGSTLLGADDPLDYIADVISSATAVRRKYRCLTVADTTLICNREVPAELAGAAIDYKKEDASFIRDTTNSNNVASWNDLPHPPAGTCADGDTQDDEIYFTRDNDLGWPAGWYRASSTTTPPWYTRIRSESANSLIDHTTWPVRLDFDGTDFDLNFPDWTDRYSGDSFTNPGPQISSGPSSPHSIKDFCFFQGRLWFGGYEFLDSSQTSDVFNMWNTSYVGITDVDPINVGLQSDAVTRVDFMVPFDGGIVVFTRGSRQFEIKSQGAMTPSTVSILPTTSYTTVVYCAPAKLGNQLYFASEQNESMVVYEYIFQQERGSNVASNITGNVEGYIPDAAIIIRTSNQNDMLFLLTSGDQTSIYVCQMQWDEGQNSQRAWSRWTFADTVMDFQIFDSQLYIIFRRNNKLYLETVNIDLAPDDDDGLTPTTIDGYSGSGDMGFAIRLDARASYQGVYDAGTNTTTWTVPYEDASLTTVVLGQMWDCNYEFPPTSGTFLTMRQKGKILTSTALGGTLTVSAGGGSTTLSTSGNFATNGNGDNAPAWIGIPFEKRGRLNEQYLRDDSGPVMGSVQLKHLMVRLVRTGGFKVEITPQGRDTITFEYQGDQVGQMLLGTGLDFEEHDEFNLPCLAAANGTIIEFVNDSPYPSRVIGGEFRAGFVPAKVDPTRR